MRKSPFQILTLIALVAIAAQLTLQVIPKDKPAENVPVPYEAPGGGIETRKRSPHPSVFGLSVNSTKAEVIDYRESITRNGYRVHSISNRDLGKELDGLDAEGLGREGFEVIDPSSGLSLLTAFLEADGSVGLITCEFPSSSIEQDGQVVLSPGEKVEEVRKRLKPYIRKDLEWILLIENSRSWISCRFFKGRLNAFTITKPSRGPVNEGDG